MYAVLEVIGPQMWRPVPGFPGYEVSSRGQVRSYRTHRGLRRDEPRELRFWPGRDGYRMSDLHRDGKQHHRPIHRLVLEAFVGPRPPGHEAAHCNGVRTDNRWENLAWVSPKENASHKELHGTVPRGDRSGAYTKPERLPRGERHWKAKLTEAEALEIRELYATGSWTQRAIATKFGVTQTNVGRIVRRRTWSHVA